MQQVNSNIVTNMGISLLNNTTTVGFSNVYPFQLLCLYSVSSSTHNSLLVTVSYKKNNSVQPRCNWPELRPGQSFISTAPPLLSSFQISGSGDSGSGWHPRSWELCCWRKMSPHFFLLTLILRSQKIHQFSEAKTCGDIFPQQQTRHFPELNFWECPLLTWIHPYAATAALLPELEPKGAEGRGAWDVCSCWAAPPQAEPRAHVLAHLYNLHHFYIMLEYFSKCPTHPRALPSIKICSHYHEFPGGGAGSPWFWFDFQL